jgi:GNAT superfamily N-acetyltransferase
VSSPPQSLMTETARTALFEQSRDGYTVSTDPTRLDHDFVFRYLNGESYWSRGIARAVVERAIAGSLCFGLYAPSGEQCGYARVATDYATLAWLSDVFALDAHRGRGLGRFLVATVMAHPRLQGLRRWMLSTTDAHGLYEKFGFVSVEAGNLMTRLDRESYKREA